VGSDLCGRDIVGTQMTEQEKRLPSIHIRLEVEDYKRLQQVAKAMDRPVSYLIAQILHEWCQRPKGAD